MGGRTKLGDPIRAAAKDPGLTRPLGSPRLRSPRGPWLKGAPCGPLSGSASRSRGAELPRFQRKDAVPRSSRGQVPRTPGLLVSEQLGPRFLISGVGARFSPP